MMDNHDDYEEFLKVNKRAKLLCDVMDSIIESIIILIFACIFVSILVFGGVI